MTKNMNRMLMLCTGFLLVQWNTLATAAPCAAGHCSRVHDEVYRDCQEEAEQNKGKMPEILIVSKDLATLQNSHLKQT